MAANDKQQLQSQLRTANEQTRGPFQMANGCRDLPLFLVLLTLFAVCIPFVRRVQLTLQFLHHLGIKCGLNCNHPGFKDRDAVLDIHIAVFYLAHAAVRLVLGCRRGWWCVIRLDKCSCCVTRAESIMR